jgi:hypothetical protein
MIVATESLEFTIPEWVKSVNAFRRWAKSSDFPEFPRFSWIQGKVWIDMSQEQIFSHVQVKTKFTKVLDSLAEETQAGLYLTDGVLFSNPAADVSNVPDGIFILNESFASDRVRFIEGSEGGYTELVGSPDVVVEIVSHSSIKKDVHVLYDAYWNAGVSEYWLVDARNDPIRFDIFRRTNRGFVPVRKQDDWVKSAIFGKSFRLVKATNVRKLPECVLQVR